MTKEERQKEVSEWMRSLGFNDNRDAEIPNFQCGGLQTALSPNPLAKIVAQEYPDWDPIDDITIVSPQCAMLFYLAALDMVLEKTGNKDASRYIKQ